MRAAIEATTRAPRSPSSRSFTRPAATPAPRRVASTRRSETRPRTVPRSTPTTRSRAPTTWATRTRSSSSPRGARRHLPARELGRLLLARRGRPPSAAPVRRRRLAAHGLRRGHHRPRPDPGALRAARPARHPVYEEYFAWKLVEHEGRCQGVISWDLMNGGLKAVGGEDGRPRHRRHRAGSTRDHERVRLHRRRDGDGAAAGLPLKDMEFMQFHPTTMYPSGILITEGCRGEGGTCCNSDGERFMERYAPTAKELAEPRRRLALRADGDRRGPRHQRLRPPRPDAPRRREDPRRGCPGSRELAMVYAGVDPILRADPGPAGRPLPHGRRRDGLRRRGPR